MRLFALPIVALSLVACTESEAQRNALASQTTAYLPPFVRASSSTAQASTDVASAAAPSMPAPPAPSAPPLGVGPQAVETALASTPKAPADMELVPAGTFRMGSDSEGQPDEQPAHAVTLPAFYLDLTEVTKLAYAECKRAGACKGATPQTNEQNDIEGTSANKPITQVTWEQAQSYCSYRGKRLPREAEFERAVRGDDGRRFPWGNQPPSPDLAVFATNSPADVGAKPRGRGPYGHSDLAGNVWEWMSDYYDPVAYTRSGAGAGVPGTCPQILATQNELRADGRRGFTGSNPIPRECERVLRGGAYNYAANGLRSTNRVHHPGSFRLLVAGFRCAKDL
jgi:formylglycine-generating enzyme required for sulfatase activity